MKLILIICAKNEVCHTYPVVDDRSVAHLSAVTVSRFEPWHGYQQRNSFAAILLEPNVTNKMLSELAGISIAAINGDRTP